MRKLRSFWIVTAIAMLLVALVLLAEAGPALTLHKSCDATCGCPRQTTTSVGFPGVIPTTFWATSSASAMRVKS
jgi:hypothetical protein